MLRLFNLKIVFADEYEQLKEDWENQNTEIDRLTAERNRKQKAIEELIKINRNYAKVIDKTAGEKQDLLDIIAKLEAHLEEKESQRRKTAAKVGGYQKEKNKLKEEISKLKEANEFLKNNRRAPNLEELKDYTLRRKRGNK